MPAWNEKTRQWVKEGKLTVVGISQEQHGDRCRLFAQWKQIDWPILSDPINVMQVKGVPIEIAIDEYGIVRSLRPDRETFERDFLNKKFEPGEVEVSAQQAVPQRPDPAALLSTAQQSRTSKAWRDLGDALVLWGGLPRIDDAIEAYRQVLLIKADEGDAHFRLGVCYLMRYESPQRKSTDFQTAVNHWTAAREIEPNQYIWRRRIEQYGARLNKPYPFYDWVQTASDDITGRGETPVKLSLTPTAGEMATPARGDTSEQPVIGAPDPQNRIFRDTRNMIEAEVTVVPQKIKPGGSARVYITLRPNARFKAHWNNQAPPLTLWVDSPATWKARPQLVTFGPPVEAETSEPRRLEFEITAPDDAADRFELSSYALYYVCEDAGGTCSFLRLDIPVTITIDE